MSKYRVGCNSTNFYFCCGVVEVGNFESEVSTYSLYDWDYFDDSNVSSKDAWTKLLKQIRNVNNYRPLVFNFTYESPRVLKGLVCAQEDCLFIHKWRNPSTENIIEQYMLTNKSNARRERTRK